MHQAELDRIAAEHAAIEAAAKAAAAAKAVHTDSCCEFLM